MLARRAQWRARLERSCGLVQAAPIRFLSRRATGAEQIGFDVATPRLKAPGIRSANIERWFARRRTSL